MPILLGLLASFLIGSSDFLGARSSGRSTPLQSTTAAFLAGTFVTACYSPLLGTPTVRDLALGALSGVAVFVALTVLWWGYARSSIGVAAPMAAVVATVVPVLYGTAQGDGTGVIGWIGVAVGVMALFLTSWAPKGQRIRDGVALGALSGIAFALMFIIAVSTSEGSGTWPVVSQRATAFVCALVAAAVLGKRPMAVGEAMRWSMVAGVLGAAGVGAIVYGGQRGPITPVIVSGSMYPAVAIALAWLFLHQRLRGRQIVGLVGALVGVALISID